MKRKIVEDKEYITSSAMINPQLSEHLSIEVRVLQGGEGPIPHVHVYHDKTRNPKRCSAVRLDKAEYSQHHKNLPPLDRKMKEEFIQIMNSRWVRRGSEYTGYVNSVDTWVDTYEHGDYSKFDLDENGVPKMPDYEEL